MKLKTNQLSTTKKTHSAKTIPVAKKVTSRRPAITLPKPSSTLSTSSIEKKIKTLEENLKKLQQENKDLRKTLTGLNGAFDRHTHKFSLQFAPSGFTTLDLTKQIGWRNKVLLYNGHGQQFTTKGPSL